MEWLPWLERQAANGNEAAVAALKGLRYRANRSKTVKESGLEGEDLSAKVKIDQKELNTIAGTSIKFDIRSAQIRINADHSIYYFDGDGKVRLRDHGPRIDLVLVNDQDQDGLRAGLLLASQKFGGEVFITGSVEFKEQAAREALAMGIKVRNPELTHIQQIQPDFSVQR